MIGYLSLGRDTFDIKYAKHKFNIISKVLTKVDQNIYEFEKLILSLVLLLVMSLMGGSLIVISAGDHQSNNTSDQ